MTDPCPEQTPLGVEKFDFSAYPEDTLFHDRRVGGERRGDVAVPARRPRSAAARTAGAGSIPPPLRNNTRRTSSNS